MSACSCVAARRTMRSVLQTQGDSRARSGPVIGLGPRPSTASCYSRGRRGTRELYACTYIIRAPSVWNPHSVGRRPKEQKVRARLLTVTTRGDHDAVFQPCAARQAWSGVLSMTRTTSGRSARLVRDDVQGCRATMMHEHRMTAESTSNKKG